LVDSDVVDLETTQIADISCRTGRETRGAEKRRAYLHMNRPEILESSVIDGAESERDGKVTDDVHGLFLPHYTYTSLGQH
jgi:hypothetical protein